MEPTKQHAGKSRTWPESERYRSRYFVPDLSPQFRSALRAVTPRIVFVAESPYESEVAPEREADRRPLCGKAGRDWWKMIASFVAADRPELQGSDTSLERLLELCRSGRIAVMNAVQYPLDPKITGYHGKEADPVSNLGFTKVKDHLYKKRKDTEEVQAAVAWLRDRLEHPAVADLPVVPLGNDAEWFVTQALHGEAASRIAGKVPHPSAWWRGGGVLREKARRELTRLLR